MDTRILIAIVLSLGLIFLYQELVLKRLYPPHLERAAPQAKATPRAASTPMATPPLGLARPLSAGKTGGESKTVEVETTLYDARLVAQGARIAAFTLKQFHETAAPGSSGYEMIRGGPADERPFGLVVKRDDTSFDDDAVEYRVSGPSKIDLKPGETATVTFSARTADGLELTKSFVFDGSGYTFALKSAVSSAGRDAIEAVGLSMGQGLTALEGYYDVPELQAEVGGKVLTEGEKNLRKGVPPASGEVSYAGFGDRYFLSVMMPLSPRLGELVMGFDGQRASAQLVFSRTASLTTRVYMGPKELDTLEAVNPKLRQAIDFGWAGALALIFLRALKLFHDLAPNYGVDILLMTLAIRVASLPLSVKSQRSMMRLQRLQPQVERIREKFKDDSERLNREMIDLYKRNHVNPLGGCLPMLIQLPIFIGLYEALLNAVELRHAPFVGWIKDLSAPDCFPVPAMPQLPMMHCSGIPVLVLLMGLSTYVQQWMSPASPDPNQQRMMMLTPVIFTIMLVNFPAGLSLYYFASNVLGIIQQFILNREFKQSVPVAL